MYKNILYALFSLCIVLTQSIFTCQNNMAPACKNDITHILYQHAAHNIQKYDEQIRATILRDLQATQEKKNKEEQLQIKAAIIQALTTNSPLIQEYLKSPYALEVYSDALITNKQHILHLFQKHAMTFNSLPTQYQLHVITQACSYENYQLLNTLHKNHTFAEKIISLPLNTQDYINRIFAKASQFFD